MRILDQSWEREASFVIHETDGPRGRTFLRPHPSAVGGWVLRFLEELQLQLSLIVLGLRILLRYNMTSQKARTCKLAKSERPLRHSAVVARGWAALRRQLSDDGGSYDMPRGPPGPLRGGPLSKAKGTYLVPIRRGLFRHGGEMRWQTALS